MVNLLSIKRSPFVLLSSDIFSRGASAVTVILLARSIGIENYGVLAYAIAFGAITSFFADSGITHTYIRESTGRNNSASLVGSALFIRIFLAAIVITISCVSVALIEKNTLKAWSIIIIISGMTLGNTIQGWAVAYYQSIQRVDLMSFVRACNGLLIAAFILFGILVKFDTVLFAACYSIASLSVAALCVYMMRKNFVFDLSERKNLSNGMWAFAFGGLIIMLSAQYGVLILEAVEESAIVGIFAAAGRFPQLLYRVPGSFASVYYAKLFSGFKLDVEVNEFLSKESAKMISASLLVCLPFVINGKMIMSEVFKIESNAAATTLSLLSIAVIVQAFYFPFADKLSANSKQSLRNKISFICFLIGGIIFYVSSMKWGIIGAAASTLFAEILLAIGFALFNQSLLRKFLAHNGPLYTFSLVATIFSYIISIAILNYSYLLGIISTIALSTLCLFVINRYTEIDLSKMAKSIFRKVAKGGTRTQI